MLPLVLVTSIIIAFPLVMVEHQEMVDRRDHDVELLAAHVLDQVFIVGRRLGTVLNFLFLHSFAMLASE